MRTKPNLLLWIAIALFWVSCDNEKRADADDTEVDTSRVDRQEMSEEASRAKLHRMNYPVPAPEQTFVFLMDHGVKYQPDLMVKSQISQYEDVSKEAIHFGMLIADLAYAAANGDTQKSKQLYEKVHTMRENLDVEGLMENKMHNVSAKLDNKDSLKHFADHFYVNTVKAMEHAGMSDELALMSSGEWIESMHIMLNAVDIAKYNADNKIERRIGDQKVVFSHLYTYLRKHAEERGIQQLIEDLEPIRKTFASLAEKRDKTTVKKSGRKLEFGGGTRIHLSKEQYQDLKSKVDEIRNNYIS
jgi:hypothetical protein